MREFIDPGEQSRTTRRHRPEKPAKAVQLSMFSAEVMSDIVRNPPSDLKGMVRRRSKRTSVDAARIAKGTASKVTLGIVKALKADGPQTDAELERRPEFADAGESTVRKRRCDLTNMKPRPWVRWNGDKRPHPKTQCMVRVWEYCGP